ncbi:MAG TPA: amidophosphoribosyltransferase [bacterium]|nr:amidophosphoribosyltransferase [bacterium]
MNNLGPEETGKGYWLEDDKPHDQCGVFGIYGHSEAAKITYLGLHSLQHRGQESAGICTMENGHLFNYKRMGLVADIFNETAFKELPGKTAIGHVRYSTTGSSQLRNAQPIAVEYAQGNLAIAHNGNLVNARRIRDELEARGSIFVSTVDSEVIVHLVARSSQGTLVEALISSLQKVRGAYSLLILSDDGLLGMRDPSGFRPLCLGKLDDSWVLASETCAFDIIDAKYVRDVEPGEIVMINENGLVSIKPFEKTSPSMCIFEYIYFARPDSRIYNTSVQKVRKQLGRILAKESHVSADVVVPVPDSSNMAATGYAEESKVPYEMGLIRNHYVGRTFIEPDQTIRDFGARLKYNAVKESMEGKRVILIDDSIVRGTTMRKIIKMIRNAGAKEVHLRITSPPIISPCFYGMDFPSRKELIAATHSLEEIQTYLRVDSLAYLSVEGMMKAVEGTPQGHCTACFTAKYPVAFDMETEKYSLEVNKC